jgi:hypothetical protein
VKLQQLSLFVENKPGSLTLPCRLLADAGVNIVTFSLADTEQYGILRLMVRDVDRARATLERNGFAVKITEVVAIEVADRPGGLIEVLSILEQAAINVDYFYAFTIKRNGNGVIAFRFSDPDTAIRILQQHHVTILNAAQLMPPSPA